MERYTKMKEDFMEERIHLGELRKIGDIIALQNRIMFYVASGMNENTRGKLKDEILGEVMTHSRVIYGGNLNLTIV